MLWAAAAAQRLPGECLHGILDCLWGDSVAARFLERRSQYARDYDQRRAHRALAARALAPLHVCRAWRACAVRRFFRYVVVDLRRSGRAHPLPMSAQSVVSRLFVLLPAVDAHTIADAAQNVLCSLPLPLTKARILALCVFEGGAPHAANSASDGTLLTSRAMELAAALRHVAPRADSIWLQTQDAVGAGMRLVVEALLAGPPPAPVVTAINLPSLSSVRSGQAIDVIRRCARDLVFLSLGSVFGGALSDLVSPAAAGGGCLVYRRLRRLLFTVDADARIFTRPLAAAAAAQQQQQQSSPFPQLEELYFDDAESNGLPREEWYAPLYDMFLRHENAVLRYLTFPIVYNTQRTVGRHNCPRLAGLRHIKCCWATGAWGALQQDSDSTRVLKAIATIPTLECYVHPSYIARLSGRPTEIGCRDLSRLDLYGWPLTLADLAWVLRAFGRLHVLRVTLVSAPETDDSAGDLALLPVRSPVSHLAVGSTDAGLCGSELAWLLAALQSLRRLAAVSLYSGAYAYVKGAVAGSDGVLRRVRIANLDRCELLGQATSADAHSFRSPLAQFTTARAPVDGSVDTARRAPPAPGSRSRSTSWNVVRQLLIDG
ncbi:hypothetical protein H4R21_001369 [Coemansia helicoidea]|uniref:Uncharacterized protein n=1 Tax=Coemansia helicoidea TaxID=1286919 RepID=A0ACC1LC85_9FUNG|nr:hypothetical protein H4R21_001369 [Coemansia helicoidea]